MWTLINQTPFVADHQFVQSETGDLVWMVAIKATFDIDAEHERLTVSKKQVEVYQTDRFRGNPQDSSLVYSSDFSLNKPNIDILLEATAFSPKEQPVKELLAGFRLGQLVKIVKVVGNRMYEKCLGIIYATSPSRFLRMPLTYEKSYGGRQEPDKKGRVYYDIRNPAGKGYFRRRADVAGLTLPNIEYPRFPTKQRAGKNKVAGFGPIASHWSPRINHAGLFETGNQTVFPVKRNGGFNLLYYQTAPIDQQLPEYLGGEIAILYNLHPRYDHIQFKLPSTIIHCKTLMDGECQEQEAGLHTIFMRPDQLSLQMVWQANIVCKGQGKTLEKMIITHEIKF